MAVAALMGGLLALVGCGEDGAPASAAARPVTAVATSGATAGAPAVTVMADGSLELRPRITDVAMLERRPDGSYLRKCGPASPELRANMASKMAKKMADRMDAMRRARPGTP